jgi:hypothetical protein
VTGRVAAVSVSPGVVAPLRAPPVPSATPGSAERVAACRVDIARLVGEPEDVSVDLDLADGADADEPVTVPVPAGVASCDAADEDEPESEGSADATQGVAASPAPMPTAKAHAPTRPINLTSPIVVCLSSPYFDEAEIYASVTGLAADSQQTSSSGARRPASAESSLRPGATSRGRCRGSRFPTTACQSSTTKGAPAQRYWAAAPL